MWSDSSNRRPEKRRSRSASRAVRRRSDDTTLRAMPYSQTLSLPRRGPVGVGRVNGGEEDLGRQVSRGVRVVDAPGHETHHRTRMASIGLRLNRKRIRAVADALRTLSRFRTLVPPCVLDPWARAGDVLSRRGWFSGDKWFKQGVALAKQGRLEEARDAYLRSAESDSVNAQYNLALIYIDLGDRDNAILWFRRAAAAGDAGAMHSLALHLADGGRNAAGEALHWYSEASVRGHAPSQYNLALHYQATDELPLAERHFEQAAKQGHLDAEVSLAGLWLGRGRKRESEEILRRAAAKKHPGALDFMGKLAQERGDTEQAAGFYARSHAAGFSGAAVNLGLLYEEQQRVVEAEEWLRKAADAGNAGGMYALGRLLVGLDRSDEALVWFRKAAALGYENARHAVRVVTARKEK